MMPTFAKRHDTTDGRANTVNQLPRTRMSFTVADCAMVQEMTEYFITHARAGKTTWILRSLRQKMQAAKERLENPLVDSVRDSASLFDVPVGAYEDNWNDEDEEDDA